jgi:hypothetical protein
MMEAGRVPVKQKEKTPNSEDSYTLTLQENMSDI